jgi:hypothetical protein
MLRKLIWAGLLAGLTALAAIITRHTASGIWRMFTGEDPPVKKR